MRCDATQHSITTVKRCGAVYGHDPDDAHRFDVADLPRCTNHDRNRDGTSTQQCTKWIGHDGDHRYVEPVHSGTAVCYNTRPYGGVRLGTVERCVRTTRHDPDGCEWPTDADARGTQEELAKVTEQRDMYSAELAKVREDLRVAVAERDAGQQVAIDRAAYTRRLETALADARCALERINAPIPMLLVCPACGERHVDAGLFATKVHHTHACQHCGTVWRPAIVATVGVQFLPGFKDEVTT